MMKLLPAILTAIGILYLVNHDYLIGLIVLACGVGAFVCDLVIVVIARTKEKDS